MSSMIVCLVLLPFATALLGAVLGLLDRSDMPATLRRIAWRGMPFVVAAWMLGKGAALPSLGAVVTALTLHTMMTTGVRWIVRSGSMTRSSTPWWGTEAHRGSSAPQEA